MDQLTERLVEYAQTLSYEDLPPEVVERTKRLILDTIGCALGAAPWKAPSVARALAEDVQSRTPATVMVGGQQTSPDMAAFANGVMTRYLDYNDYCYTNGSGHPSDTIAPVLAAVEAARGDGKSVILGTVMAYDILLGLSDSASHGLSRGWGGASFQVIAAAVAASRLLGLTHVQMRQAIGMAVSSHISLNRSRGGQISNWKAATSANDSRNGVFCALAALQGMTGPVDVFAGKGGFFQNTGSQFEMMPLGGQQGTPFRIMGAEIKGFPAGYPSHTGIEAALALQPQIKSAADIKEIRLFTGPSGMGYASEAACWHPETRERADHSHPFLLSLALAEGSVEVRHFEEGYYKHPEIVALMQKVKVQVGNEPEHQKAGPGMPTAVVEVDLHSCATLRLKKGFNAARAAYLRTDKGQEEKLRPMAEALLPKVQTDELFQSLRTLDQQRDIRDVLALTIAPQGKR